MISLKRVLKSDLVNKKGNKVYVKLSPSTASIYPYLFYFIFSDFGNPKKCKNSKKSWDPETWSCVNTCNETRCKDYETCNTFSGKCEPRVSNSEQLIKLLGQVKEIGLKMLQKDPEAVTDSEIRTFLSYFSKNSPYYNRLDLIREQLANRSSYELMKFLSQIKSISINSGNAVITMAGNAKWFLMKEADGLWKITFFQD